MIKHRHRPIWAIVLISSLFLSGCNFFPEPVSLIQAPKQAKAANKMDGNNVRVFKGLIPNGAALVPPNEPVGGDSIIYVDFDKDGENEAVALYKSNIKADQIGAVILRNDGEKWKKLTRIAGTGYEISWASTLDITGDGIEELLIGWKVGVSAGNVLDIYKWKDNDLKKLTQLNYHELEVINPIDEKSQLNRLAIWKRDIADVYNVDILKWEDYRFIPDQTLYPSYFSKVADYYEQRANKAPDTAYYWYYLADSLFKAEKLELALTAINRGLRLDIISPSVEEFIHLKAEIETSLQKDKSKDVQYYVADADITLNIPRNIAPYISIDGSEENESNYVINVNVTNDRKEKGLLFAIDVYSKYLTPNLKNNHHTIVLETDKLVYVVRRSPEHPFADKPDSKVYEIFHQATEVMDEMISSIRLGSTFPKYTNFKEKVILSKVEEAVQKSVHVSIGGDSGEGVIKSFTYKDKDYRYLGKDIDTFKKLNKYLTTAFTAEAIQEYIKGAEIIEQEGKLAQPNADGGSLLDYSKASVLQTKDSGTEKEFDLKVPVGDSLTYRIVHIVFKKTEMGWRLSTNPGTF